MGWLRKTSRNALFYIALLGWFFRFGMVVFITFLSLESFINAVVWLEK